MVMRKPWRVVRDVLKWSGIAVLGLLALAFLLFAVAFIINARDEELSPQARALLTPPPNPYKPEDNIYLALAGADAPPGKSVIAAGLMRVSAYNQRVDALMRSPKFAGEDAFFHRPEDPDRLEFRGDCSVLQPLNGSLWQVAPQHLERIQELLADNRELYQRYLTLHGLHGYYETARLTEFAPLLARFPVCERRLFLAEYVRRMRSANSPEQRQALADLQSDVQLWRAVLKGEGTLVSMMVSVAYLHGDYLLLADTIADPRVEVPLGESEADSVVPVFDLRDWDLGSTFASEFRVTSSFVKQVDGLSTSAWTPDGEPQSLVRRSLAGLYNRVNGHFFKLNATENLLAAHAVRRTERARDPDTFFRTRHDSPVAFPEGLRAWALLLTYNPGAKVLATSADAAYDEYPPRVWDAAALQRLVRLSYEIRRQRIATTAIPAFLKQHPEWSTHPADGRPFLWDAGTGELRIQTVAKQPPDRRFSVSVWQAPTTN
jgi:hypothetical protein